MPCLGPDSVIGGVSNEAHATLRRFSNKLEATLCGILRTNGTQILDRVDWKEAGVTKKWVEEWWEYHKRQDAVRINEENRQKILDQKRNRILDKLTAEEKKILGLK